MITWMQRHKKWLITTIWVSTIAFVGAGFVGWGSYNYGKKGNVVATVGDREITVDEYQREYSSLYERYASFFGAQFNQEMAQQLKLQDLAYNSIIQKNLLLAYADEIGLDVTDEEIANQVVGMTAFSKNGKFDKDIYVKVLKQNGSSVSDFEKALKRDLLLNKLNMIFALEPSKNEIKTLDSLLFSQDNLKIKIIDENSINVSINDEELKKYYEENKNAYLSPISYEIETFETPITKKDFSDEELKEYFEKNRDLFVLADGKLKSFENAKDDVINELSMDSAKKDSLKDYLKLKKGELTFTNKFSVYENELKFSAEDIEDIKNAKAGDVLKPFTSQDKYITVKVNAIVEPKPLSYEEAKELAKSDFVAAKRAAELKSLATKAVENFSGKNVGYVSRSSIDKIDGLDQSESSEFLQKLFTTNEKTGVVYVGNKAVVYSVTNAKLADFNENRVEGVKNTIVSLQNNELMSKMVDALKNRYNIETSLIEGKE